MLNEANDGFCAGPNRGWLATMDLSDVGAELLDGLPANRTLGLRVLRASDAEGQAVLAVKPGVHNVIGALHSSGITALVDAAGLAALIGCAPHAASARRLQPLGIRAELAFHRPVRGMAIATCRLDSDARQRMRTLYEAVQTTQTVTTTVTIDGHGEPVAVTGRFEWTIRMAQPTTRHGLVIDW